MVNKERLINTFLDLVKIDGPIFYEKKVADFCLEHFMQLGIECFTDEAFREVGSDTGNLIARIDGQIEGKAIMFNAHLDSIESTKNLKIVLDDGGIIRTDGKTILGADDRIGIAAILEMATVIKESEKPHSDIEIVFTVAEEKGLLGAKALSVDSLKSKNCFSFDGGGKVGSVIVKATAQNWIDVEFKGMAAHAGIEPEKGVSAILALSKAISYMKTGRIDEETTANVGVINGGKATNIIADKASFKAEARSLDKQKLKKQTDEMVEAINKAAFEVKAKANVRVSEAYDSFSLSESDEVVRIAGLALKELGITVKYKTSGGGSDANVFNQRGIKSVVLGIGAEKVHTFEEQVKIGELEKAANLAVKIVEISSGTLEHA